MTFAGLLAVQLAWAMIIPAFRGMDEHDHAYRAASVAQGHWLPDYQVPEDGRGDLIPVPASMVTAANRVCEFLDYTRPDNCVAVRDAGDGDVLVASAAARYNPVFYWVVATPARPFEGATALYVMRGMAGLMCAALIAAAAALTSRWRSTLWPSVALLAVVTPAITHSAMVAAPNGVELTSAVLLWVSLLGLATSADPRLERHLLIAGGLAAACLTTVHTLGPLWLALILFVGLWVIGPRAVKGIVERHRRLCLTVVATTAVTTACAVGWTLIASPNNPAAEGSLWTDSPWPSIALGIPLWVLQCIAAFPLRNQAAPLPVYAGFLALWAVLITYGVRLTHRRGPMVFVAAMSLLIPIPLTLVSYSHVGLAWQGRYGYPLSMGVLLLAGLAVDRAGMRAPSLARFAWAVPAVAGIATLIAQFGARRIVIADDVAPAWQIGPAWLVVLLTVTGYVLLTLSLQARRTD